MPVKTFPFYKQFDQMDCGPTCLRMVAKYYGKNYSLQKLREACGINRGGVSLLGISEAAEKIGFRTSGLKVDIGLLKQIDLPLILHWRQNHFVILYKIKGKRRRAEGQSSTGSSPLLGRGVGGEDYYIADPGKGLVRYTEAEFIQQWLSTKSNGKGQGIVLTLSPTPDFYMHEDQPQKGLDFGYVLKYLYQYKQLIAQLFVGLLVGSLLQLILPFLTQSVVDIGISTKNLNFIELVLIAQTMLFLGRMSVEFIRSWILLHITTRLNLSILTDFLIKLMKLPISFFDTKMTGDIMQRMSDQGRIQSFLTGSSLSTIFSLFNFVVYGAILAYYNLVIFGIFMLGSGLYALWIILFLKKRRDLDFKRFDLSSKNQSAIVQLIGGMQEIKLNNCEQQKRWEWERLQAGLFRFSISSLSLSQLQQSGTFFINESKNIVISFLVAKAVVDGQLTLGGMMAIQSIIGQLNSPVQQILGFIQSFQDAKISMERLNEVREIEDEEPLGKPFIRELPSDEGISLREVSFTYSGAGNEPVLQRIDLNIPQGKTTAIVGVSGSGKTTILKLLLRFYKPGKGEIRIGNTAMEQISFRFWRSRCGTVMQDGYIFSDTIARNIAVGDEYPDMGKIRHAMQVANITDFIESLPLGLNTKIGAAGNGISQGQKQRILIARAVYKNPAYLFFDEATNALDANNERIIMQNLETFFKGKTVVVVAHRLSTVKNADNIVVLEKGEIIEQGTHTQLTAKKGAYYQLVKNQLELGT